MGSIELPGGGLLRPLEQADVAPLHALIERNRAYLAPWLPWATGQTPEDTAAFVARTRRQMAEEDGFQSALCLDGELVGVVGYHGVDWTNRSTSIGYWLSEDRQGRGAMTAAVRGLVDHAFSAWELNRVEIRAAVGNRRSRAIPERLGFTEEGTLRGAERVGDRYLDCVLYAVLRAEWRALAPVQGTQ